MEQQPSETAPKPIFAALQTFIEKFTPVFDTEEADETMTTSEIADYLEDLLDVEDIDKTDITIFLKENGFQYEFREGFRWLFRYKNK